MVAQTDLVPPNAASIVGPPGCSGCSAHGLHTDRLSLDPQRLQSWQIDNCQPPRRIENATDRIPEEVISPLLVWALRWVNDFSDDILAARDEWWLLYIAGHPRRAAKPTGEKLPSKLAALQRLLDEYRRRDVRCQPTLTARPIGISLPGNYAARTSFLGRPKGQAMIAAAVAELGTCRRLIPVHRGAGLPRRHTMAAGVRLPPDARPEPTAANSVLCGDRLPIRDAGQRKTGGIAFDATFGHQDYELKSQVGARSRRICRA